MKWNSSSEFSPDLARVEGVLPAIPTGVTRHARPVVRTVRWGLVILSFQVVAASVWAEENIATNELAYLGSQPGERTLTLPPAHSEPVTGTTNIEWFGELSWWHWSRLTGNWAQLRPALEANGLTIAGRFTTDTSMRLSSGTSQRGIQRGLLDLNLALNPEPLLGIRGGTFFAQYFYRYGPNGSDVIGDLEGFDDIDSRPVSQTEEIWYEQKLLHNRLRLKVGQVDANAEFDNLSAASGFINSSTTHSPTLLNFPTYPDPALSANVFVYPTEWFYCGAGVYTGNLRDLSAYRFNHPYGIGEAGFTRPGNDRFGPGQVAMGFWHNSAASRFDRAAQGGTSGYYVMAEQQVWKQQPGTADVQRGVSVFAQYGSANPEVSPVAHHVGVGASATDLLPERDHDSMGIYWSWAELSRARGAGFTHDESTLEGYYHCQVTPFFALKPDLQWIRHPGCKSSTGAAWVVTLRVIIDL